MNDFKVKVTISNSQHIPAGMIVWMPTNLVIPFLPAETYTGKLMSMNIKMLQDDGTTTVHDIQIIE